MKLILDIEAPDGTQRREWLGVDEVLHIGSSSQVDVCLDMDRSLLGNHFSVNGSNEGWELHAMPGASVSVNGFQCKRQRLKNGDLIQAGQIEFHVSIEGVVTSPRVELPTPEPSKKVASKPLTYSRTVLPSGVMRFEVNLNDTPISQLFNAVKGTQNFWVLVNKQRTKVASNVNFVTEDLFANAPDEIRESDSLFLGKFDLDDNSIDLIREASQDQGAILVTSEASLEEVLESQKIVWAWYSRPAILSQQLNVGSKQLAEKLFSAVNSVLILERMTGSLTLFVRLASADAITLQLDEFAEPKQNGN